MPSYPTGVELVMPVDAATPCEPLEGSYFVSTYPPFSCWNDEGAAEFEGKLGAQPARESALGLYVHVPFCVQRCQYCYYLAYDNRFQDMDRYLQALERELELVARMPAIRDRPLRFVYFGGGTPSVIPAKKLDGLMSHIGDAFPRTDDCEVTFECAPKSVTSSKLRVLRDRGVTRLSLGVQQLDDDVLQANGRLHLVSDVLRAWDAVREFGFAVVNVDLIVGLVGQTDESFLTGLDRVIELAPDSVTLYQLEIPLNTPLYRDLQGGGVSEEPASWATKRARLDLAFDRLEDAGYTVRSAYSAVQDPARHRFVYQEEQYHGADLLGLGASAFSHLAGVNHQNLAALSRYLEAVEAGRLPLWRGHEMSAEERCVREFVLQLKLGRVEAGYFRDKFGPEALERFSDQLLNHAARGYLQVEDDGVTVTREGLLRIDRLLPSFYLPQHRGLRYS